MQVSAPNNDAATVNQADPITATVTIPPTVPENGIPGNLLTLLPTGSPGLTVGGTVSFYEGTSTTPSSDATACRLLSTTRPIRPRAATRQSRPTRSPLRRQYSGDAYHQASSNSVPLTVNPQTVNVNVGTIPSGLSFSINGTPYSMPQSPTWNVGTNYTLGTTSPQSGTTGTQYLFSSWSDGGAITHAVPAPASSVNYTASFTTQYLLNASAGPGGTVSVANGYYNAQSVQSLSATPSAGYTFTGWTGSGDIANPAGASTTVTMNGPETVRANFTTASTVNISPSSIDFGTLYLGSIVTKTVTSRTSEPLRCRSPVHASRSSEEAIRKNLSL